MAAQASAPEVDRPTDIPDAVKIGEVLHKDDPGPSSWKPLSPGQMLEDVGINDSRFVFYHGKFSKGDAAIPDGGISISPKMSPMDAIVADVGGVLFWPKNRRDALLHVTPQQLDAGVVVTLLYENGGHENGGPGMENKRGIESWVTTISGSPQHVIGDWRSKQIDRMDDTSVVGVDVDDSSWEKADVETADGTLPVGHTAVYRATVNVSDDQLKDKQTQLRIGRIDDLGVVYVNGEKIADTSDWSQVYTFDVAKQLKPGKNVIAIIVKNTDGAGGLAQGVSFESAVESSLVKSDWQYSGDSAGSAGKWWASDLDDSGWEKLSLGGDGPKPSNALLTWYRVKFELPEQKSGVWVPWKIRMDATGNGFVYLNDHPLGRYWQIGPQREYFLPECWLKFGQGQKNVVTLSLRPTNDGASLKAAEVSPYAQWAEKR